MTNSNNKRSKRTRKGEEEADDDNLSQATDKGNNTSDATQQVFTSRFHVRYYTLQLTVPRSKDGTECMRNALMEWLRVLQDADSSTIIRRYAETKEEEEEVDAPAIVKSEDMPTTITKIGKFIKNCRPLSDGGKIYCKVKIAFDIEETCLLEDTSLELRELGMRMYKQAIQHHSVTTIGYLQNVIPDIDIKNWTEYFNACLAKGTNKKIKIGLISKPIFDGAKNTSNQKGNRARAIHVETQTEFSTEATKLVSAILKSDGFKLRYGVFSRLTPLWNRMNASHTNDKIKKCIGTHTHLTKAVASTTTYSLTCLDQKRMTKKLSAREMILNLVLPSLNKKVFISIEEHWSGNGHVIFFPQKYERECNDVIAHLGAYLDKNYGTDAKRFLTEEEKVKVSETIWDKETGAPITKSDKEMDDTFDLTGQIDWFDISVMMRGNETQNLININNDDDTFNDMDSTSTWGTKHTKKEKEQADDSSDDSVTKGDDSDDNTDMEIAIATPSPQRRSSRISPYFSKSSLDKDARLDDDEQMTAPSITGGAAGV